METIKTIYIYGKSGHGSVVRDIALANGFEKIIYIDDDESKLGVYRYDNKLNKDIQIALGIGDNKTRKAIALKIIEDGFKLATLIHPSAIISPLAKFESGTVVMPLCVINANVSIGKGCILNSSCVVEHDCKIKDFVHISPNASLAGNVEIGELTHVGIGSNIIEGIKIGKNNIIGASSAVINDIEDNLMYAGVPAKEKRKNI